MGSDNEVSSYLKALDAFKDYVKNINSENSNKNQHQGYLINLNRYHEFKEKIKKINNNSFNKYYSERKIDLSPEDTTDLMECLNHNYKFIIINNALHKKICQSNTQNAHQINYIISPTEIILYTENSQKLHFKNNKDNKIDKSSLLNMNEKINNVKKEASKIYIDLINYFKLEKEISEKINNKNIQEEKYEGFLVDKTWLDKWKKYSFYDKIKNELLLNKKNDKNIIIEKIIEEQKNTGLNYNEINNIENFIIKDINQLESEEISDKSFALINKDFLYTLNDKINIRFLPFEFYLTYQNIEIRPNGKDNINFQANNNIISKYNHIAQITMRKSNRKENKINNMNNLEYLKHLIKTIFLKNEFLSKMNIFLNKYYSI